MTQQGRLSKSQKLLFICMRMVLLIGILSLKMLLCPMARVNYVILDGLPFVMKGEKLIVEPSIMQLLKFYKAHNMICQSIYGVSVLWLISY